MVLPESGGGEVQPPSPLARTLMEATGVYVQRMRYPAGRYAQQECSRQFLALCIVP